MRIIITGTASIALALAIACKPEKKVSFATGAARSSGDSKANIVGNSVFADPTSTGTDAVKTPLNGTATPAPGTDMTTYVARAANGGDLRMFNECQSVATQDRGGAFTTLSSLYIVLVPKAGAADSTVQILNPINPADFVSDIRANRKMTLPTLNAPDGQYYILLTSGNSCSGLVALRTSYSTFSSWAVKPGCMVIGTTLAAVTVQNGSIVSGSAAPTTMNVLFAENPQRPLNPVSSTQTSTSGSRIQTSASGASTVASASSNPTGETACDDMHSPLILDLANTGISLSSPQSGADFDIVGDGVPRRISWPDKSGSYFLTLDRNNNGQVDGVFELFGNNTVGPDGAKPDNGFLALAKYDLNHDGQIDAKDSIYNSLRLWDDSNRDGKASPEELHTLASLGVSSIDLAYLSGVEQDQYGNQTRQRSAVKLSDGTYRMIFDVWFVIIGGLKL